MSLGHGITQWVYSAILAGERLTFRALAAHWADESNALQIGPWKEQTYAQ
jgi:hypothetical protein